MIYKAWRSIGLRQEKRPLLAYLPKRTTSGNRDENREPGCPHSGEMGVNPPGQGKDKRIQVNEFPEGQVEAEVAVGLAGPCQEYGD